MNKTAMGCTETDEGFIPHLKVKVGDVMFFAPVKLVRGIAGRSMLKGRSLHEEYPIPERRDWKLVYALPGGIEGIGQA